MRGHFLSPVRSWPFAPSQQFFRTLTATACGATAGAFGRDFYDHGFEGPIRTTAEHFLAIGPTPYAELYRQRPALQSQ